MMSGEPITHFLPPTPLRSKPMPSSLHTRTAALAAVLSALSAPAHAHVAPDSCGLPDSATPASYLATNRDSEKVDIHAQPDIRSAILAICDNQSEAAVLGKIGTWYRVRLAVRPNQPAERRIVNGYVHQSQVSLRHVYTVHSADGPADLRLNADHRAEIQQRIPNGTTVAEHPAKRRGDWHYVSVHGSDSDNYGYVHKSQLRPKAGR